MKKLLILTPLAAASFALTGPSSFDHFLLGPAVVHAQSAGPVRAMAAEATGETYMCVLFGGQQKEDLRKGLFAYNGTLVKDVFVTPITGGKTYLSDPPQAKSPVADACGHLNLMIAAGTDNISHLREAQRLLGCEGRKAVPETRPSAPAPATRHFPIIPDGEDG